MVSLSQKSQKVKSSIGVSHVVFITRQKVQIGHCLGDLPSPRSRACRLRVTLITPRI